ncbi:MAG: hypothetical protein AAFR14_12710, partial [Bacteroidota bacterium]
APSKYMSKTMLRRLVGQESDPDRNWGCFWAGLVSCMYLDHCRQIYLALPWSIIDIKQTSVRISDSLARSC